MAARMTGAIGAIIAAGLLIWVITISFGPEEIVAPTVKVTTAQGRKATTVGHPAGTSTTTSPEQILAARTELLRDRTRTGPKAYPMLATGEFHINTDQPMAANPQEPRKWLADNPGDHLVRKDGFVVGDSTLPYKNAAVFEQPQGRDWRRIHNGPMRYGGGWLIFGTIFTLAFFLAVRGRIRVDEGFSGQPIGRFGVTERANHWMTATAFVVMAITGLIILYGKRLLIPLIGERAFGSVAYWSIWVHMAFAVPFVLGILIMVGLWTADNLPTWADWEWLKEGGGFFTAGTHPPAYKFNAGEKILFWAMTMSGIVLLLSGVTLMFPFYWFGYSGMQATQLLHACLALTMIAMTLGHIYIGTIGMDGAFEAMWKGVVDRNWAKEHHGLWYERVVARWRRTAQRGEQIAAE